MSRKHQIKRSDENSIADHKQINDRFVTAALFKVTPTGKVDNRNPVSMFLLNPDNLEDSKSGNWVENNIPGQSDPVLQWVSGGARNLNFTALVTKDTTHFPEGIINLGDILLDSVVAAVGPIASAFAGVNIPPVGDIIDKLMGDVATDDGEELTIAPYLDYYRSLMYPYINEENVLTASPPIVLLAMGKTLSSLREKSIRETITATNHDLWVTKNVSIRVTKWLPNLTPMEAEVSFQFTQYIIESKSQTSHNPSSAPKNITGLSLESIV